MKCFFFVNSRSCVNDLLVKGGIVLEILGLINFETEQTVAFDRGVHCLVSFVTQTRRRGPGE